MKARFVGGTWDGRIAEVSGARYCIAPVPVVESGTVDDFRLFEIRDGEVYRPPMKVEAQRYRRRTIIDDNGERTYVYELEPVESLATLKPTVG